MQKLIITDIDGTITKSDLRGFIFSNIFKWYHKNVFKFFIKLEDNNIIVIYLSMRSI